jgi:hypothetical protein
MISRLHKLNAKFLDSLDRRWRRSRPGSVLILVVALLVLLALLGTAYINTAQSDRYSSAQNSFNTEVEMLLQGLESITQGTVTSNLFGSAFHQDNTTVPTQYAVSDYPTNAHSAFIADRYPTLPNLSAAPNASTNFPFWRFISQLPVTNNKFESPYVNGATYPQFLTLGYPQNLTGAAPNAQPLYPTFVIPAGSTLPYPALFDGTHYYLAADTDGDGIADAGLFRLPVGQLNGVTYYGAVRIVDNSAAVNAAIAWQPYADNPAGPIPGSLYPTNVDLLNLLNSSDSLTALNGVRFGGIATPTLTPVIDDRPTVPTSPPTPPAQPAAMQRTDGMTFANPYEAFWMQLGRRIANPGYNTLAARYAALPASEMQTMARHFILRDPNTSAANASSSTLEQDLANSVFNTAYSSAYSPNNAVTWYQQNFDFVNKPGTMPIRSMLVTQNAVSNFVSSKLYSRGNYAPGTPYSFGDWVFNPVDNRSYVSMQSKNIGNAPQTGVSTAFWEPQPWVSGPVKVSANTATFGQLWAGYFSAMSNLVALPPASAASVATASPEGSADSPAILAPNTTSTVPTVGNANTTGMFRSSIRNTSNALVSPSGWGTPQELQLRAALAAINTLDLRDADDDITSRDIVITGADLSTQFKVTVYGSEKEPYITEVFADANAPGTGAKGDYIAIELYNPTTTAIKLTNWQLAYITRPNAGAALNPQPIPSVATNWKIGATTIPTIPAGGFIVLANSATAPIGMIGPTATVSAASGTLVPDLDTAFGSELVLLRPRAASGTLATSASALSTYNESTITDLVPVDSYDFTGLTIAASGPPNDYSWHYIRPNDPNAGKAWHFVYPGPYTGAGTVTSPRQLGTGVYKPAIAVLDISTLGKADATYALALGSSTTTTFIDRPLPIASQDMAGPKSAATYPYGGFARNGDLMQVTYIGAYRIEDSSGNILELNPVTLDSAMANDENLDDSPISENFGRQNIGRFCPVHWADTLSAGAPAATELADATTGPLLWDDYLYTFSANSAFATKPAYWPQQTAYNWTLHLFDYLTVQAPHDDYLPDTDPVKYTAATAVANSNYLVANAQQTNYPASATEEAVPVHGRININTANWRVLATLPFVDGVTFGSAPNGPAQVAEQIAQSIVYYRDIDDGTTNGKAPTHPHGPFQSIYELNDVPLIGPPNASVAPLTAGTLLRTVLGTYDAAGSLFLIPGPHASNNNGDLAPYNAATPGNPPAVGTSANVLGDFENQNLALNRISNLITTRSDSFTAYVLVQGWHNAGTAAATLVVQRRGAFIIDRSTITPANNTSPAITNVPTE